MQVKILNASTYENTDANNGDSIIIDTNEKMYVYDCGCREHAERAIKYAKDKGYEKFDVILSHNDSDHFDGIPILIESGMVNSVITNLLFKHTDEILKKIDDKRRTKDSVREAIKKDYDNIYSLSGTCKLVDAYEAELADINIVGPDYYYMIEAVAKRLDGREGNTLDGDTAVNATSIQLSVVSGDKKMLLTGDATYEAIKNNLDAHNIIQLCHHGKAETAEKIFEHNSTRDDRNKILYLVSDNTGNTNGGSEKLESKGHRIKNTRIIKDDITVDFSERTFEPKSNFGGDWFEIDFRQ